MDAGTALLLHVCAGVLLGAVSSAVTRVWGVLAGVWVAAAAVAVGLTLIAALGGSALLPVVAAMLAFSVAASVLDPPPGGLFRSTR